jgi:hypothetical protein
MIQMRPRLQMHNPADGVPGHAILPGQYLSRCAVSRAAPDVQHLLRIQALASEAPFAALADRVEHVLVMGSDEQVCGIDTRLFVAVMAQLKTVWDVAARGKPRESMRPDALLAYSKDAIPAVRDMPSPHPTAFAARTVDIRPEACENLGPLGIIPPQIAVLPIESGSNTACYVNLRHWRLPTRQPGVNYAAVSAPAGRLGFRFAAQERAGMPVVSSIFTAVANPGVRRPFRIWLR